MKFVFIFEWRIENGKSISVAKVTNLTAHREKDKKKLLQQNLTRMLERNSCVFGEKMTCKNKIREQTCIFVIM